MTFLSIPLPQTLPSELEQRLSLLDVKEKQQLLHQCLYGYNPVEKEKLVEKEEQTSQEQDQQTITS